MKKQSCIFVFTLLSLLLSGPGAKAQTNLAWDPGIAQAGTEIYVNSDTNAGSYLFSITTTNTANNVGYWRSVLTVTSGEADLFISTSPAVATNYYTQKSDTTGNDRLVTYLSPGQTWYILVESEANSAWTLFAGNMHVQDLTWDPGSAQSGTEVYTNLVTSEGSYLFRIVTENTVNNAGFWRTVLNLAAGDANLYTYTGANISDTVYSYRSEQTGSDTIVQTLTAGQTRYILVEAEEGASWSLFSGDIHLTELTWDPGSADAGSEVFNNANTDGGAYYFRITTELADLAAWRTALDVVTGEADLYIKQNALPYSNSSGQSYTDSSTFTGDDGFTRYLSNTTGAGQTWYILVLADTGSTWNLFSGDVYAADLGELAADASSGSGLAEIPPEGIRYFRTTIPAAAYAWRLWLQDAAGTSTLNNPFYVRHGLAPHPSNTSYYDRTRTGQGLLVPTYVVPGSPTYYYVGIPGLPGDTFQLDSRQQEIVDEVYNSTLLDESASGFLYKTYRIPVPPDQIAWEITVEPVSGTNPDMAVRLDQVPNEFNNNAFSEISSTTVSDSITLVPTTLSDGTFYVTVYGDAALSFNLRNREPIITQIDFNSSTLNDDPTRVGWRYFAVSDIGQQLGQLGWLLELSDHVPGTEIAIRRNYVPGRWNFRQNGSSTIYQTSHNDKSSTLGFLQDPDHAADVWYIGIYSPYAALGAFTLDSGSETPVEIPLDGHTNATVQLPPNSYAFYHVDVPAQTNGQDILGWELRMTSWTGERPYMYIRRDQLPATTGTPVWYYPWSYTTWPSGYQWATWSGEWSGYTYDPGGQAYPQTLLSMAMGAPLEPGSYFIAFYNNSSTVTGSYSFTSRAIGNGMAYEPQTIAFSGGSAVITNLPARSVEYFKVSVPSNTPSWNIRLENTVGESQLYIRESRVPTWQMSASDTSSPGYGFATMTRLKKTGNELFTLLPESGQASIPEGDYYLMVVSEGQAPSGSYIGTGTCSAVLHSLGEAAVSAMGTLNPGGMLSQTDAYVAGETDLLQFNVASNVPALEVRLEGVTGTPTLYLRRDSVLPAGPGYGIYSGTGSEFNDTHIVTIANPSTGTWSVVVGQFGNPAPGSYTLEVHALDSAVFAFDGGGLTNVVLPPEEWRFYYVEVPAQESGEDVLGWELRMTSWTNALPAMYIRRNLLPSLYGVPAWYYPWSYTTWPGGYQWGTSSGDWSGYSYDPGGQAHPQTLLSMAMGAPLEPGRYEVAFYNSSQTDTGTFSFTSRAIGSNMTYSVPEITFNGGSATVTDLPARDVRYFKVAVPPGMSSWRIELENLSGESQLYVREARVPTWSMGSGPTTSPGVYFSSMTRLKISGNENFTLLPENGQTTIPSGDYYLMVVSEGQSPAGSYIGSGTSSAILRSHGEAAITDLGVLNNPGETTQADSYGKGEFRRYQFTVPPGVLTLQIRLDDRVGSPEMNLRLDTDSPNGADYGVYSGYGYQYANATVLNFTEPAPGTWTLMINDSRSAGSLEAGSYTLRFITAGTTDITFDSGGETNVDLPPLSWKYYRVEVPAETNGNPVIGWEVRTTEWSGNRPTMYIRRDELPETSGAPAWYYPWSYTTWPSGYQWGTAGADWSQRNYSSDGSVTYPKYLLSMGMGAPLEPGTYYIGFYNNSASVAGNYSFTSSAIGNDMTYDPQPIAFAGGSATITNLPARDVQYFEVDVPAGMANWKIKLENTSGESALYIREAHVPTWSMSQSGNYSPGASFSSMVRLDKTDNEHYILLPESGAMTIPEGTYYLMAVSLGENPTSSYIGTGTSSAILHSLDEQVVPHLGDVPLGGILSVSNTYEAGEADNLYRFNVTNNFGAIELRLLDVAAGDPRFHLRKDGSLPNGPSYGLYSGYGYNHFSESVFAVPNPVTGTWSVAVSDPDGTTALQNGDYRLQITHLVPTELNFDALLNTNGNSNVDGGVLADNQRDYYRVDVPATLDGEPIAGWYLTTSTSQGDAQVRVRRDLLPDDAGGGPTQTPFRSPAAVTVPPLLSPGTWYVEVKGVGATSYTITSSAIWMEREWTMPAVGEPITTPGLTAPLFGDSGVNDTGNPLPTDQGVDLENGFFHFYSVTVPMDNAGLLRTQLEAISGNPNLYIRAGMAPTADYSYNYQTQYDHLLNSTANTEYGNWVPYDGRYASALEAGTWYLMVKAEGTSNARYRLKVSGGNAYPGGNVQDLELDGGSLTGQLLADNDWRHYRLEIPTNAPADWNITYSQVSGNVDMFLRDTMPAGNYGSFSDITSAIRDWNNDQKNRGTPRPNFPDTGTHTVNMPPLRPGHVYYLGILAKADAQFSISSAVSGGTIPDYERVDFETGFVSTNIPPFSEITYQVEVPADAVRWIHSTTNTSALDVYLEQGTLPSKTWLDHAYWTSGNGSRNQYLLNPSGWPWRPGYTYYFTVANPGAAPEPFILVMKGSKAVEIPQNLTATDGTYADRIRVNWSAISGAASYEVWRNTVDDAVTATHLASTASAYYDDYTAAPGQLYYYWVSAGTITNTAWFSDSDSGWVPGVGAISPTQRIHSPTGGVGTIDVTAPAGTHWNATESLSWITINSGTPGTNDGTVAYTVSVYAGETARTGTVTVAGQAFTVVQEPLGVPATVHATDGMFNDRVEITWDALEGADRYYLYRNSVNTTVGASSLGYVTTNFYADLSGVPSQIYYYWVRPWNPGGYGGYSIPDTGYRSISVATPEWIATYFPGGYPGDNVDSDGDGYTNGEEFIAATIPIDILSYPQIDNAYASPGGYVIEWVSVSGRVYGVLWTDSLLDPFTSITNGLPYPIGSFTDTVHSAGDTGFYKLEFNLE
jgi:hypothetical protein